VAVPARGEQRTEDHWTARAMPGNCEPFHPERREVAPAGACRARLTTLGWVYRVGYGKEDQAKPFDLGICSARAQRLSHDFE